MCGGVCTVGWLLHFSVQIYFKNRTESSVASACPALWLTAVRRMLLGSASDALQFLLAPPSEDACTVISLFHSRFCFKFKNKTKLLETIISDIRKLCLNNTGTCHKPQILFCTANTNKLREDAVLCGCLLPSSGFVRELLQ